MFYSKNVILHNCQQVTWSKDHTLRLWQIDPTIQAQCGRDQSSEDTSISCGTEEDSPSDNGLDSQREKPSDLQLALVNDPDAAIKVNLVANNRK